MPPCGRACQVLQGLREGQGLRLQRCQGVRMQAGWTTRVRVRLMAGGAARLA